MNHKIKSRAFKPISVPGKESERSVNERKWLAVTGLLVRLMPKGEPMARIYLSGSLFSLVDRHFNRSLKKRLETVVEGSKVTLPQDFRVGEKLNDRKHLDEIFAQCKTALENTDLIVAVIDGPDVDSGVAFEIGYAFRAGIPVVGIRTDYRNQQSRGVNLMVDCALSERVSYLSFGEDMDALTAEIVRKVKKIIPPEKDRNKTSE